MFNASKSIKQLIKNNQKKKNIYIYIYIYIYIQQKITIWGPCPPPRAISVDCLRIGSGDSQSVIARLRQQSLIQTWEWPKNNSRSNKKIKKTCCL